MKPSEIGHGQTSTLELSPESGRLPKGLAKGHEVRLVFSRTTQQPMLSVAGATIAVDAVDEPSRRRLGTLRDTDPARICWVVARRKQAGNPDQLTVQVHRFGSRIHWLDTINFGVDERIVERIEAMTASQLTPEKACRWLAEQVLLPPVGGDSFHRAIATGAPDARRRFRLLGARVAVDINTQSDQLRVERVVSLRGGRRGFRPPETLIEASLAFVDATLAGEARQSIRAQLDQLVSEADSYIGLWKKYQYIEREHLARRAREVGWLEYTNFKPLPSGLWRFEAKDTDALGRFRDKLATSGQEEIQADAAVPKLLLEGAADDKDDNSKRSKRVAVGTVERIRLDRTVVLMRPLDEDSDTLPPARGVLFAALQGDQKRLMRREHAVRRIRSADARMPQLGLLLEGHPTPIRRTDKVRALTPAARKIFDHDPTPEQRQAIDMALNTPDIVVIQGPPGTGKTKVISAIEARLAELEEERPEIAGRTLLTSYQHDAVDNAVSRSLIFGLPPMRFGGRRGVRGADQQTQRWSAGAHEHVSAKLAELPPSRPAALYRRVRDRVATYASGHLPHAELKELLDELVALPTGTLPTELWERLRALAGTPQAGPRDLGLEHSLMVKAARGLRTEAPAFEDDGPRKARQALKLLTSLLTDDERSLLEEAAGVDPGASFRRQDELAPLRDAIIDRLNPDIVPGEGLKRLRPDVLDALNAAVAALHEQMRHDGPGAIADTLEEYAEALRKDPAGIKRLLSQYAAVYAATCQQAVGHQVMVAKGGESAQIEFDNVIVDEAARANPLDLFIPMSLAKRRIILVGDHRQLPHLLDPDVERAISGTVRDQEQHALKESLFERLFVGLPHLSVNDAHLRVITLADQFRMHPTLGQFVSDVFYEPHGEGFRSPRPASDFVHRIPGYLRADRPVCAAWQTIDHRQGPERSGKSKSRPSEARWIAREVRRLLVDEGVEANNIGIISFYRAQVDVLLEALVAEDIAERDPDSGLIDIQPRWQTIERQDGKREERLRVGTVDAFQGKEFDVVFLSITRSNTLPAETEDHRRAKYGHLMLANRLCVAMSRQRKLLVAVGDRAMFNTEQAREAVPGLAHFLTLCGGEDGLVT